MKPYTLYKRKKHKDDWYYRYNFYVLVLSREITLEVIMEKRFINDSDTHSRNSKMFKEVLV